MPTRRAWMLLPFLFAGCKATAIVHEQDERSANHIVFVLAEEAGIDATTERSETRETRYDVVVARADYERALQVLERFDLPERQHANSEKLFKDPDLIPSTTANHARVIVGIEGDLESKLRAVPRFVSAQ